MMRLRRVWRSGPCVALVLCGSLFANDEQDRYAWVQADTIFGTKGRAAALAFAAERKGPDVEKLRAYLATAKPQPKQRALLNEVMALFQQHKNAEIVARLAGIDLPKKSLLDARIWRLKAYALERVGQTDEALKAQAAWTSISTRLGWLRGQEESLSRSARIYGSRRAYAELAEVNGKLARVETARGKARRAALARTNQAGCYVELGRLREGLAALPAAQTIPNQKGWLPMRASGHEIRATAHLHRGEFAKALYEAEQAESSWKALGHADGQSNSAMLLGVIHLELGDFTAAEARFQTVQQLLDEGETLEHAQLKGNLGNVAWRRHRHDKALRLLGEAKTRFEKLGRAADAAAAYKDIGEVLLDAGRPAEAVVALEEAIKRNPSDPLAKADALAALAQAHVRLGHTPPALAALKRARKVEDAQWDRRTRLRLFEIEAQLLLAQDKPEEAVAATRLAMDLMESTLSGLSDDQTFRARNQRGRLFEVAIEGAFRTNDAATILECLERSRAVVLREAMGNRSALLAAGESEEQASELQRDALEVVEARLRLQRALTGTRREPILAARTDLVAAENTLRTCADRADRERKRRAGLLPVPPVSLGELRAVLRADEAMVIYSLSGRRARALVVTQESGAPVELGDAATIRSACERASESYRTGDGSKAREQLRKALVVPVALPEACQRVIVCPDGDLSYLPWPDLFESRYGSNAPSASTLATIRGKKAPAGQRILAVGAIDYAASVTAPAGEVTRGPRLLPLPHSRAEVSSAVRQGSDNLALLGKNATEAKIRTLLGDSSAWRTIHFACHGVVDRRFPRRSALVLTPSGSDDGWLTVPEILALDVSTDLVVLSACESGSGAFLRGEGVVGLARAFLAAGAPRVLASLWKVNDEATKELMTIFYQRRSQGDGPAAALRAAQTKLQNSERWSHPKYWAAWVIWGIPD